MFGRFFLFLEKIKKMNTLERWYFGYSVDVQLQDTKVSDHVQFGAGKCIKKRYF